MLADEPETVIFVSALPPLCVLAGKKYMPAGASTVEEERIAVGLWNSGDDPEQVMERLGNGKPDVVVTDAWRRR